MGLLTLLLYMQPGPVWADDIRGHHREVVDIGKFDSTATADGIPSGWRLQPYRGRPLLAMERNRDHIHVCLSGAGDTAFGIRKDISVDLSLHPYLNWSWKAVRLPRGGDVRKRETDDQALQIYLAFHAGGFVRMRGTSAIAYIWDNLAPIGLKVESPQPMLKNVRYVVMRNGMDQTGQWHIEKRNAYKDYQELFGTIGRDHMSPIVEGVLLFINTHNTKGEAEGCIGNIFFSSE